MAHKKGGGSTRNGRDSQAKRLGVKVFGNAFVNAGGIIVRQRGTVFALVDGTVAFEVKGPRNHQFVKVVPVAG